MRFSLSHPTMRHLAAMLILLQTVAAPAPLLANPTGGEVVAGSAAIASHGSTLNVTTHTDRAVINWQGFSIGAGEAANFIQPGADSAVLNRVTTPDNPSAIYGQLNSNGNVFLVNPSGILIGPTGVINVNGFTASVFDISNHEFMSGGPLTFRGDSTAGVVNQGAIYTGAGGVALLGHQVVNSGLVSSDGGAITLATGGSITLADGSRYIQADLKTLANGISETASLIKNSGVIRATGALKVGGEVYLVNPAGNILHDGTIKADRLAEAGRSGGSVKLEAAQGETRVEGEIDVSGTNGGRVEVLGQKVELAGATIDAGGTHGGGVILAGGDFQGGNPDVLNAQHTTVDAGSVLNADATVLGDGGRIILWADGSLEFRGNIAARGGELGGDGGFAEVSGLGSLTFHGLADLGATAGAGGQLLLDPTDVVIDPPMATAISATLNIGSDVTMYTAAEGTDPGNITLAPGAVISWNTSGRLELLARQDIWLHGQITATAGGSVTLAAGWDGSLPFAAASGTYGNGDGSVWAGASTAGQPVLVTSDSGDVRVYTHTLYVLGGSGANPAVIGSRDGATAVEALCHVLLHGGGSYAQLGYHGGGMAGGPISVNAGGAVGLAAEEVGATAQIGHGGASANIDVDAPIAVTAGSVVYLLATAEYTTAQIGHGGFGAQSPGATLAGNITVQSGLDFFQDEQGWPEFTHFHGVGLEAPGLNATAQIGHGGYGFSGNASGDIEVTTEGTVGLYNSRSSESWWGASGTAQIGHGGCGAEGALEGNISIACGDDFIGSYLNNLGATRCAHYNGLRLSAEGAGIVGIGGGTAHIGHGGRGFSGHSQGDIEVASDGTIVLQASGYSESLAGSTAQIGHGGYAAGGSAGGSVSVLSGDNFLYQDDNYWTQVNALSMSSSGSRATTQIGHGGYGFNFDRQPAGNAFNGTVLVEADGSAALSLYHWSESDPLGATAQIGHGGYAAQGNALGEIRVESGSGPAEYSYGLSMNADGPQVTAQIGHGGYHFIGNTEGAVTVVTEGTASVSAHRGQLASSSEREEATAQIGHGGCGAEGTMSGDVRLTTGVSVAGNQDSLRLDAGGDQATAQIGHGGRGFAGAMRGEVVVETAGSLAMYTNGTSYWNDNQWYHDSLAGTAQIGHGGHGARGSADDPVSVTCGTNAYGDALYAWAHGINGTVHIGHGGRGFEGSDLHGNVTVTCLGGSVYLAAASSSWSVWIDGQDYAYVYDPNAGAVQVGHGGFGAVLDGLAEGEVTVAAGSSIYGSSFDLVAQGLQAVAQVGHGGRDFVGDMKGEVNVSATGPMFVLAGGYTESRPDPNNPNQYIYLEHPADSTAQIGHGGFGAQGSASGLITGTSGASDWGSGVSLSASGEKSTAQIGHGGREFVGAMTGAVCVETLGDVQIYAQSGYDDAAGNFTYGNTAQIGHGGYGAQGPATGSVTLIGGARSNGQGLFLAGMGDHNTAQIGHGGYGYNGQATGDVVVESDGSVSVYCWAASHQDPCDGLLFYYDAAGGTAQIGHGGRAAQGGAAGDIAITSGVDDWSFGLYVCASDGQVELHDATVHVGHGGRGWTGAASGDIAVATAGDARLWSGNTNNDAKIGHGGRNSGGAGDALSGAIEIIAGLGLNANATAASNAWIAHGGPGSANPVTGDILLAYDQLDPIAYGGGNFVLGATAYIGAPVGQAPAGSVRIFGTQREGNSIHNGAAISGVAFNNALPRPSFGGNQWNWAPRTQSWAHEQWGYTLAGPGPYTAPFTFFFWHDTQESGPVFDLTWAWALEGASAYDRFIRPQDQWRTLSYLLGGPRRGRGIGYGSKPDSGEENLVEVGSFDLFGPGSE